MIVYVISPAVDYEGLSDPIAVYQDETTAQRVTAWLSAEVHKPAHLRPAHAGLGLSDTPGDWYECNAVAITDWKG